MEMFSLFALLAALAAAKRIDIKKTLHTDRPAELLQATIYSKEDIFGSEQPRIEFDFSLVPINSDPLESGKHISLLILTLPQTEELLDFLDVENSEYSQNICCVGATCVGELNLPSEFNEAVLKLEDKATYSITESAYYFVFAVNCAPIKYQLVGSASVINPYGYVPGVDGRLLFFYPTIMLLYILHLAVWAMWLLKYFKTAINIQRIVIPTVIAVCVLEAALKAADFWVYNDSSVRSDFLSTSAIVAVCWRGALARFLMLCVCKGWGVVTDKIPSLIKASLLSISYFIVSIAYYKVRQQLHGQVATADLKHTFMMVSVPLSVIDTIFFSWTLQSLNATKVKLEIDHQAFKLRLFNILTYLIYSAIGSAVVILFFEGYDVSRINQEGVWQRIWIYEASWNVIFWVVLIGVTILWKPNKHSHLLATTQQIVSEDIDLEFESAEEQNSAIEMSVTVKPIY
mmetsp:Transcript_33382/g.58530  ORF Transcript_33382/g.58530 Transcript_33382/m.58530 type:complete len:458 (-) Transcript_33382:34-1407(-)